MNPEQKLIESVRMLFSAPLGKNNFDAGIGDDTAFISRQTFLDFFSQNNSVLPVQSCAGMLFATDTLVEGIHFRWDWSSPQEVAHKLVEMNASDVYCKGGTPLFGFLNLSVTSSSLQKKMPKFLAGLKKSAAKHNIVILGGDTTASAQDTFTLTLAATAGARFIARRFVPLAGTPRRGIEEKDILVIMGEPGWSGYALDMLLQKKILSAAAKKKHTAPCSYPQAVHWLFSLEALISIDQSDSLLQTLQILSHENNIGFHISLDSIPSFRGLQKITRDYVKYILSSGEDFSVLAVIPREKKEEARRYQKEKKNFAVIGEVFLPSANPKTSNVQKSKARRTDKEALLFYQQQKIISLDTSLFEGYRHF